MPEEEELPELLGRDARSLKLNVSSSDLDLCPAQWIFFDLLRLALLFGC